MTPLDDESDETFLSRRAEEERLRMAATSCIVRAVHEEMVEIYQERLEQAEAGTAEFDALIAKIADD